MKDEVIALLAEEKISKPQLFNKALALYRQSRDASSSQVRFLNTLGFNADRLEGLLYDLKKLHGVSDIEISKARQEARAAAVKLLKVEDPEILDNGETDTDPTGGTQGGTTDNPNGEGDPNQGDQGDNPGNGGNGENIEDSGDGSSDGEQNPDNTDTLENEGTPEGGPETPETGTPAVTDEVEKVITPKPSDEETDKLGKDIEAEKEKFFKHLSGVDTAAVEYNELKSLAAVAGDYLNEEPENQKKVTLIAFVEEAKKKYSAAG